MWPNFSPTHPPPPPPVHHQICNQPSSNSHFPCSASFLQVSNVLFGFAFTIGSSFSSFLVSSSTPWDLPRFDRHSIESWFHGHFQRLLLRSVSSLGAQFKYGGCDVHPCHRTTHLSPSDYQPLRCINDTKVVEHTKCVLANHRCQRCQNYAKRGEVCLNQVWMRVLESNEMRREVGDLRGEGDWKGWKWVVEVEMTVINNS